MATQNSINKTVPFTVSEGGTGASTLTDTSLLVGNGTSAVSALGAATDGQVPIGNTGSPPTLATLTEGTLGVIVNGPGTIAIGSGIGTWVDLGTFSSSGDEIVITGAISSRFESYRIELNNLAMSHTSDVSMYMLCSTDNGSSYLTTNQYYGSSAGTAYNSNTLIGTITQRNLLPLSLGAELNTGTIMCGTIWAYGLGTADIPQFSLELSYADSSGDMRYMVSGGQCVTSGVNALKIELSGGSFSAGNATVYGFYKG